MKIRTNLQIKVAERVIVADVRVRAPFRDQRVHQIFFLRTFRILSSCQKGSQIFMTGKFM